MTVETLDEPAAAASLGITRAALARLRKAGRIGFYQVSVRRVRYSRDHLAAYLAAAEHKPRQAPAPASPPSRRRIRPVAEGPDPHGLLKALAILNETATKPTASAPED